MNIFKIARANIRKRKGANITFLIMVLVSALMLSISLSLLIGSNNFYDKKVAELNAPHYNSFIRADSYKHDFYDYAKAYPGTTEVSEVDALLCSPTWNMKSSTAKTSVILIDEAEMKAKSFQKLTVIDEQASKTSDMIILPVSFRADGFKSGEKISFDISEENHEFTIYGFFEDAITGSSTVSVKIVYIKAEGFSKLGANSNFSKYINFSVRFDENAKSTNFKAAFGKYSKLSASEEVSMTYEAVKASAMTFTTIASLVLLIFSAIILIIALIVVRFSINNSIEEDVATIGALKSIGYQNNALKLTQLIQYLAIAFVGSVLGSIISFLTFGFIGNIIASTSGLLWISGTNIIPVLLSILLICGFTLLIAYAVTRKYKKITPINALRQGDSHHSFKKSVLPLEKYKMPLNLHLGIKKFFVLLKNNITLLIVVTMLVFVSTLTSAMSYNLNDNRKAMIDMVGLEMSEVWIQLDSGLEINEVNDSINAKNDVERTVLTGMASCSVNEVETFVDSFEDYSLLTKNTLVKGKYPKLYNEVALGAIVANATKKTLNDTVTLDIFGVKKEYVVVGITQNIGNGGDGCEVTVEAMYRHDADFKMSTIYVYLNEGVDVDVFSNSLRNEYGSKITMIDTAETMDTILNSMGGPFSAISVIMIAATIIVVGFMLFLIISAIIRKEKKQLGIMKALGYKNRQLIMHMLISFSPSLILGTLLGILIGFVGTNPLLSVFFSSAGLVSTYFIIPPVATILIGLGILAASLLIAYIISLRLNKISPQKMIVD